MRHKITFELGSPVVFEQLPTFDALAYYCEKQEMREQRIPGDVKLQINQQDGVYLASLMMVDRPSEIKAFPAYGHREQRPERLLLVDAPKVHFIFESDNPDYIHELCAKHIRSIGGKRSQGYGSVLSVLVEPAGKTTITRPVPVEYTNVSDLRSLQFRAYAPPYSYPGNMGGCVLFDFL